MDNKTITCPQCNLKLSPQAIKETSRCPRCHQLLQLAKGCVGCSGCKQLPVNNVLFKSGC